MIGNKKFNLGEQRVGISNIITQRGRKKKKDREKPGKGGGVRPPAPRGQKKRKPH